MLKKSLLFVIFILTISIFNNCEKDQSIVSEQQSPKTIHRISIADFNASIRKDESYDRLETFFDFKQQQNQSYDRIHEGDEITVLTSDILLIEKNDIDYYTFTILTNSNGSEFYNLVVYVNNNQEIIRSEIFEYNPTDIWLQDTSQPYSGYISVVENNIIDLNSVLSRADDVCITGATSYWNCGDNNNHEPGNIHCEPENNAVTEFIVQLQYGPCPADNVNEPLFVDPPDSAGGGSGNSNNNPWSPPEGGNTNGNNNTDNDPDDNDDDTFTIPMPTLEELILGCLNGSTFGTSNATILSATLLTELGYTYAEIKAMYNNLITQNNCSQEAQEEVLETLYELILENEDNCAITSSMVNEAYSFISPFNVDLSFFRTDCEDDNNIDLTLVEANEKFMCIYETLTQSPKFKTLFLDTFGESVDLDVTFILADLPDNVAGRNRTTAGQIDNQKIEINKNHLGTRHPLTIAQVIIHEAFHAFLKLKAYECNNNISIEGLDSQELDELLNDFNYDCLADTSDEHDVMFNKLLPNMVDILEDTMTNLVAVEDLNYFHNFYPNDNGIPEPWQWLTETNNQGIELEGCLFYISLQGLQGVSAFDEVISNNMRHDILFNGYDLLLNNESSNQEPFNFETCED